MKEPIPVVSAAILFYNQWASEVVQFVVGNKAVVDVLNATFCTDTHNAPYLVTGFLLLNSISGSQLPTFLERITQCSMLCQEKCHFSFTGSRSRLPSSPAIIRL